MTVKIVFPMANRDRREACDNPETLKKFLKIVDPLKDYWPPEDIKDAADECSKIGEYDRKYGKEVRKDWSQVYVKGEGTFHWDKNNEENQTSNDSDKERDHENHNEYGKKDREGWPQEIFNYCWGRNNYGWNRYKEENQTTEDLDKEGHNENAFGGANNGSMIIIAFVIFFGTGMITIQKWKNTISTVISIVALVASLTTAVFYVFLVFLVYCPWSADVIVTIMIMFFMLIILTVSIVKQPKKTVSEVIMEMSSRPSRQDDNNNNV